MFAVIAAAPLAILPAKYAYEGIMYRNGMTPNQNICVSVCMTLLCYTMAVIMPNVGMVIAVTGATVNPFIGFIFPILFYLKIDPAPMNSRSKIVAQLVLFGCILVSMLGLAKLNERASESTTFDAVE